jgi:AAA domain
VADDKAIWDAYDARGPRPKLVASDGASVSRGPLVLRSARLPNPADIPPRQWLYGTQLLRGFVTVLVAPGGTGKSTYAMVVAAALASGQKLLGEHIFAQVNTAILNLEDPMEELDRRLAAIMLRFRLSRDDLNGKLFLHSGEDRPVTMAALGDDGFTVVHPDEEALTAEILAHGIGLLEVDPFAESHTLEENSNPQMIQAAAAWRRIARATNCAILLVHHVRKGAVLDIDAARGAKGLTDSARVGLLLSSMGDSDAETLGITAEERWQYVRLDDAKTNMAPKATKARWFKLEREDLGNATAAYPSGDKVATMTTWEAPSVWAKTTAASLNEALDSIAEGPQPGLFYTSTKRGGGALWAGQVLVNILDVGESQAKQMISMWLKSGLLFEFEYDHPKYRRPATGLKVNDLRRPT